MSRTWKDNATEFGSLTKQGYGVRLAVLVACSVQPQQGSRTSQGSAKSTITEFALGAGVSRPTVQSYLNKWDRMVEAGWDTLGRETLSPDDVDMEVSAQFIAEFDALATQGASGQTGKVADIVKNPTATAKALADPVFREKVADALPEADRAEVMAAITDARVKSVRGGGTAHHEPVESVLDGPIGRAEFYGTLVEQYERLARTQRSGFDQYPPTQQEVAMINRLVGVLLDALPVTVE